MTNTVRHIPITSTVPVPVPTLERCLQALSGTALEAELRAALRPMVGGSCEFCPADGGGCPVCNANSEGKGAGANQRRLGDG